MKIVVYRADALEKHNDRSTDDEFEMIAILAQHTADVIPMEPTTMLRNGRRLTRSGLSM